MAASVAKRDVCYFTFGDEKLTADLDKVHSLLRREDRSISMFLSTLVLPNNLPVYFREN